MLSQKFLNRLLNNHGRPERRESSSSDQAGNVKYDKKTWIYHLSVLYTQKVFLFEKRKKKKKREEGGKKKKSLSSLLFVEDCVDDWKTSIIQVSQAPEVFQYLRDS